MIYLILTFAFRAKAYYITSYKRNSKTDNAKPYIWNREHAREGWAIK